MGGPPDGHEPAPTAAKGLASAPRGKVDLKQSGAVAGADFGHAGSLRTGEIMRALLLSVAAQPASAFAESSSPRQLQAEQHASQVALCVNGHRT